MLRVIGILGRWVAGKAQRGWRCFAGYIGAGELAMLRVSEILDRKVAGMVQRGRRCFAWHSGAGRSEVLRFSYWHSPVRNAALENKI